MTTLVKICGLSTPDSLDAALDAGADLVGFVRFARSPRHVSLETGRDLSRRARGRAERVLLVVDPPDRELDAEVEAIDPDLIQLHGRETPDRVAAIATRTGRPVMKAVGIATASDLAAVQPHLALGGRVLLDAKPLPGAVLPGGNGAAFDWSLLAALDPAASVMLSGGLDPDNVRRAIRATGVRAVDVSSGVERAPGIKDAERIAAFVTAARAAFAAYNTRRVA